MKKFCPKCGKTIDKGTFCSSCNVIELEYKPLKIQLCPSKKCFFKGKWISFTDLHSLTKRLLKTNVKQKVKLIQGLEIYKDLLEKPGLKKTLDVVISDGKEEFVLPIDVEITYSPGYTKLGTTYFEGILQIRHINSEVKEYIRKYLEKNISKRVFVNNVVEKNDSADYFFVTKHHIMPLATKIMKNFSGYVSQNAQLFSHNKQTSKDLFRLNVLLVLPKFSIGNVVLFKNRVLLITKLDKTISAIDLNKNKKFTFPFNEKTADEIKMVVKKKTSVSIIHPRLEIINPENYQSEPAQNPLDIKLSPGQKIVVVSDDTNFFVIKG